MYQIGDKVIVKYSGWFEFITQKTMGDNMPYFVYCPCEHGGN